MDNVEELPSWAARTHVPGSNLPVAEEPPPKRRRPLRAVLFALLGLAALAGMAALGYWVANTTGDDSPVAANETGTTVATPAEGDGADGATGEGDGSGDDAMTADAADDAADTATGADDDSADDGTTDATDGDDDGTTDGQDDDGGTTTDDDAEAPSSGEVVDNSDGSIRYAVLQGGQLFLRGRVATEEYGRQIEEVALGVMGPGNVINEYEVDPTTPEVVGGPVYVEDVVLFGFNSIEIQPAFLPILDLGTALMTQNPTVKITVVSRTDAVGSAETNLEVSRQRAQAVVNYWQKQGIDPDRLTIDARGEEDASDDDTPDEAARNRRVEFIINDLFG